MEKSLRPTPGIRNWSSYLAIRKKWFTGAFHVGEQWSAHWREELANEVGFQCQVVLPSPRYRRFCGSGSSVQWGPDTLYQFRNLVTDGNGAQEGDCSEESRKRNLPMRGGYEYPLPLLWKNIMGDSGLIQSEEGACSPGSGSIPLQSCVRRRLQWENRVTGGLQWCGDSLLQRAWSRKRWWEAITIESMDRRSPRDSRHRSPLWSTTAWLSVMGRPSRELWEEITGATVRIHIVVAGCQCRLFEPSDRQIHRRTGIRVPTEATAIGLTWAPRCFMQDAMPIFRKPEMGFSILFEIKGVSAIGTDKQQEAWSWSGRSEEKNKNTGTYNNGKGVIEMVRKGF